MTDADPRERNRQLLQDRLCELAASLPGSTSYENRRPINIAARYGTATAGDFLKLRHPHVTAEYWQSVAAAGRLLRRGVPITLDTVVIPGDALDHVIPDTVEPAVNGNIRILLLDKSLLVVYKPAPLPVHPCGRFNRNSLSWLLTAAGEPLGLQPRPAHRLDANTEGILVFTLNRRAAAMVQRQFADGTAGKLYFAAVKEAGTASTFSCRAPLMRETASAGGRLTDDNGQEAYTRFRTLERHGDRTLLAAIPVTGRTNQIRAHLWHLGMPVLGDPYYLSGRQVSDHQTLAVDAPPMCLLAARLAITHPDTGRRLHLQAPAPAWWPEGKS